MKAFDYAREKFYRNEFRSQEKKCSKCDNVLRARDYKQADGFTKIKTVRTCRFCKHIHAKKVAIKQWHGDHE